MRVAGSPAANQTGLLHHVAHVFAIADPTWFGKRQNALVDRSRDRGSLFVRSNARLSANFAVGFAVEFCVRSSGINGHRVGELRVIRLRLEIRRLIFVPFGNTIRMVGGKAEDLGAKALVDGGSIGCIELGGFVRVAALPPSAQLPRSSRLG